MATTIDGTDLQKIQSWRNTKTGNIMPIPLPGNDSEGTETIDMLGVVETIDIDGRLTGTFDQVQAVLKTLKVLVDGNQENSVVLSSPYVINNTTAGSTSTPATINVKVNKFNYQWDLPGMTYVDYQLQLIVGA